MSPLLSSAYNMLTSISAKDGDAEGAHRLRLLQAEVEKYQHTGLSVGSVRVTSEWYKDHMKVKVMRFAGCPPSLLPEARLVIIVNAKRIVAGVQTDCRGCSGALIDSSGGGGREGKLLLHPYVVHY